MKEFIKNKAFTLVELIVVIVILAILAGIAFTNLVDYPRNARDLVRKTDLNNIAKALEIYKIKNVKFPTPDNTGTTQSGWVEGEFGTGVYDLVKGINTFPRDPSTNEEYDYILKDNNNVFKLVAQLENGKEYIIQRGTDRKIVTEISSSESGGIESLDDPNTPGEMVLVYEKVGQEIIIPNSDGSSYSVPGTTLTIELPFKGDVNLTSIDWGDGGSNNCITSFSGTNLQGNRMNNLITCTYSEPGDYTITITGKATGFGNYFSQTGGGPKMILGLQYLTKIIKWENIGFIDLSFAFFQAFSLAELPNEIRMLGVENMEWMFSYSLFNGDISKWNVESVTDMKAMFHKTLFNGDISEWNVENVTDMTGMFSRSQFTGNLSCWNVKHISEEPNGFREASGFENDNSKQPRWGENPPVSCP